MMFGPGDIKPGATPLDVAFAMLGVSEEGKPNRGRLIDQWIRECGLDPASPEAPDDGYKWCSCFVCACCRRGGRALPNPSASVRRVWQRNQVLLVPINKLEPGDLLLRLQRGNHIAFYYRHVNGLIETIDGNSNEAGSRDGRDVVRKERPLSFWDGALRPREIPLVS